jgi:flagellar operon protein
MSGMPSINNLNIQPSAPRPASERNIQTPNGGTTFREALGELSKTTPGTAETSAANLKFSSHAIERMRLRGITFSPEQLTQIDKAVDKAASKGSRETLLLTDSSALIVNVNSRTIKTVMDKNLLKENVFTNIDSAVVL